MQGFFDQLIGDMRPIKVAGVDVIDSEPNDFAQDCDRAVVIFWRPEYMWTSELHGAVAHASQDQIIGELECAAGQGRGGRRFQIRDYNYELGRTKTVVVSAVLSGVNPKFISFCAETAHATAHAISNDGSHIETFRPPLATRRGE